MPLLPGRQPKHVHLKVGEAWKRLALTRDIIYEHVTCPWISIQGRLTALDKCNSKTSLARSWRCSFKTPTRSSCFGLNGLPCSHSSKISDSQRNLRRKSGSPLARSRMQSAPAAQGLFLLKFHLFDFILLLLCLQIPGFEIKSVYNTLCLHT